jgi:hypothetical protein
LVILNQISNFKNNTIMKELSIEKMEMVNGGSACGAAVGVAVLSAAAIGFTAIYAPWLYASPKTWYAAANLVAGNVANYSLNCL